MCTPPLSTYLLSHFVSFSGLTQKHIKSFLPMVLCRKQCTGMGVQGVEGAKVAFQRCQGHPVTHTKRMLAGQWIGLRGVSVERGPSIPCPPLSAQYSLFSS